MQRRERYVLTIFFVTSTFVWTTEAGSEQSQNYDDQPIELPPRPRRRKHKETEDLPPIPSEVGGTDEPALNFDAGGSEFSSGETEPDTSFVPDLRRKCESYGDLDFNGVRVPLKRPWREYTWDGRKRIVCRWSPALLKAMDVLKVNMPRFKNIYSKSPLLARVYLWWMHKTRIKRPRRADGSDTGYFSDSSSISRIASRITPKTVSRLLSSPSSRSSSGSSSSRYSRAVSRTSSGSG
nr:PREDICTED: uncharacterized protein LOC109030790 isoform X2 [Bemisia tabaci]